MGGRITAKKCLAFAGHGLSDLSSEWWLAVLGGVIGWAIIWTLDLEEMFSKALPVDPLAANAVVLICCVAAGVGLVFLLRLIYAPIYFYAKPRGGLIALFGAGVVTQMGPIILMGTGLFLFVVLFGSGAIWFIARSQQQPLQQSATAASLAVEVAPKHTREADGSPFSWPKFPGFSTSISTDDQLSVNSFGGTGTNESDTEVNLQDAYILSGASGTPLPLKVGAGSDGWIAPSETNPILPQAQLELQAFVDSPARIPERQFLREWTPIIIVVQVDGKKYRKTYSTEEVKAALEQMRAPSPLAAMNRPRVSKRK